MHVCRKYVRLWKVLRLKEQTAALLRQYASNRIPATEAEIVRTTVMLAMGRPAMTIMYGVTGSRLARAEFVRLSRPRRHAKAMNGVAKPKRYVSMMQSAMTVSGATAKRPPIVLETFVKAGLRRVRRRKFAMKTISNALANAQVMPNVITSNTATGQRPVIRATQRRIRKGVWQERRPVKSRNAMNRKNNATPVRDHAALPEIL
jgi:hypothetical protein